MRLRTPEKIRRLQRKLYLKAKAEPDFRFYLLYDKIYREDILWHAYRLARANKGAPGVDGVTFEMIEASGLEDWLSGIRTELHAKTYRAQPVRREMIPSFDRLRMRARWRRTAARHPDDPGPGGADGGQAGRRADLRGGLGADNLRLPARPVSGRGYPGSEQVPQPWLH